MKIRIYSFIFLLCLLGCSGLQDNDPYLRSLGLDSISLEPLEAVDLDQYGFISCNEFAVFENDWMAIWCPRDQYFVSLLNFRTGQEIPLLRRGRGPGEFANPTGFDAKTRSLLMSDSSSHTIVSVDIPQSIAAGRAMMDTVLQWKDVPYMVRPHCLSNGYFVASGINPSTPEWFTLRDSEGNVLSGLPAPFPEEIKSMNMSALASFVGSTIFTSSPSGDLVCAAMVPAAALSFSSVVNGSLRETIRIEADPLRSTTIKWNGTPSKTLKRNFVSVRSDSRNVYLLYSGEFVGQSDTSDECNRFIIYNWAGTPVHSFILSHRIGSMDVRNGKIYGISIYPSIRLLIFDLPDYSK